MGGVTACLIGWFYFWAAQSSANPYLFEKQSQGYYNLMTDGFLSGHLWMNVEPTPQLLKAKNPYDPTEAGPVLHDASYYKGKYYLYFGAAPAVVLLLPFKLIFGVHLPENLATALFCMAGFAVNAVLAALILRRFFPLRRSGWWIVAIVGLGLGNMCTVLLRRAAFWELPIAAAYAFASASLLFGFCALTTTRRINLLLALASACCGFAIGSRAVYLFSAVGLIPVFWAASALPGRWRPAFNRSLLRPAIAAFAPVGCILALIFWYNYERFENPFEFGMKWALTGYDMPHWKMFDWANLPLNSWYYLWAPAHWTRYFPFVQVIGPASLTGSSAYYGEDNVYGIIPNLPLVLFAAGAPLLFLGRSPRRRAASAFVVFLLCIVATNALVLFRFSASAARYMVDIVPYVVLLGFCGAWAGLEVLAQRLILRRMLVVGVALSLIITVAFNVFLGFQSGRIFEVQNPADYACVAGFFNRLPAVVERAVGYQPGHLQLRVRFPDNKPSHYEPLVTTGWFFLSDILYARYGLDGLIEFGLAHVNAPVMQSRQLKIDYGQDHTLDVEMGSMYPPLPHPWCGQMLPVQASRYKHRLSLRVDGQEVLTVDVPFYDSDPRDILVGRNPTGLLVEKEFTGKLVQVRRIPAVVPPPDDHAYGPIRLLVTFPVDKVGQSEPLVTTGVQGHGDVLLVKYDAPNRIRFAHDHWGHALTESGPIEYEPDRVHIVDIWMGSLFPANEPNAAPWSEAFSGQSAAIPWCAVRFDGKVVWSQQEPFHPSTSQQVCLTQNPIGSTACGSDFTGRVDGWRRVASTRDSAGPVELVVQLPQYETDRTEVVFSCGRGAEAIRLLARYGAQSVSFILNRPGVPAVESEPISFDAGVAHVLLFNGETTPLIMRFDGREVLSATLGGMLADFPLNFWVGDNPPGFKGNEETFSGRIFSIRRLNASDRNRESEVYR